LNQKEIDEMIERGLIKYFVKSNGERREWIVSEQAMSIWFNSQIN